MYDRLIDNYTDRATKHMGLKQRRDIRKELKSHIMDSAEALAAERNKPVDEEIVREVIAKMGPPEVFSSAYPSGKTHYLFDRVVFIGVAILAIFFILIIGVSILAAYQMSHIQHREDNSTHAGASKINLQLENDEGKVDIVESDTDDVEVIYTVTANEGHLGDVVTNTTYVQDGDTLNVRSRAKMSSNGIHIGYFSMNADALVKVPKNSQYRLDLTSHLGTVTVTALNGSSLTIHDDMGSINIQGGKYDSIDAETSLGAINAKYDAREAAFTSSAGGIDLDSGGAGDSLTATTEMGSINAKYNAKAATFKSSSGSIDLTSYGAGDSLTATTSMGHITAKYNAKVSTFKSSSGSIDLTASGVGDSLTATTSMGSIDATYNVSKATFTSSSGSIHLNSYGTAGSLTANADMGSIDVTVPEDTLFSVDASTSLGHISHGSIPMLMTTTDGSHLVGYTKGGEGSLDMKLESSSGSIEISY